METNTLIQDFAVMLTLVGFVSIFFTRLGWPKVIGFILAGALLGPHTYGGSFLKNPDSINVIGQLGVLFLMFGMGLDFNLPKFRKVAGVAIPTALIDMILMVWAGHFVGTRILGWGHIQSLFLGAAISDSATTLLAKTINDMGWGNRHFTRFIFGTTIMEDIFCIGLIALLTGIAQSRGLDLHAISMSMGGLILFLVGIVIFGILLIPRTLDLVGKLHDDESLLLTVLGICFFVSLIAAKLDYSLALGAFLVGTIASASSTLKTIVNQCTPIKTVFSAVFFITIGMMVNPAALLSEWPTILGITALVIGLKTFNCTVGSILTGQDLKNSLQTGIGLAQIGEFAYLVALIGLSLHVTDQNLYQITVGVSLLSTILNPFLMRLSDPFSDWVIRKTPKRWLNLIETYSNWIERYRNVAAPKQAVRLIRYHLIVAALQYMLVAFVFIAARLATQLNYSQLSVWVNDRKATLLWLLATIIVTPSGIFFFYRGRMLGNALADLFIQEKLRYTRWANAFRRFLIFATSIAGLVILFIESALLSYTIAPRNQPRFLLLVFLVLVIVAILGVRKIRDLGADAVMTLRDVLTKDNEANARDTAAELLDIHTDHATIPPNGIAVGKSLREIRLRNLSGANVIGIERGERCIINPRADDRLQANDRVLILGDDDQIASALVLLTQINK